MSKSTIGQRIRARRDALGLSRRELSIVLGCDQQTIYTWESRGAQPSIATLRKIAEALGTSPAALLG
jgi:hypothetical protein